MPIRKWDKLHVVTHNDMYLVSVGASLLGGFTEPYENLVRMLGTPRDDNTKWITWGLQFSTDPRSVINIYTPDEDKDIDIWDRRRWSINGHDQVYYRKFVTKLQDFRKEAL